MNKVFEFSGVNVASSHIEAFWVEAADVVCIRLSSGAIVKEQTPDEDHARLIIKNIIDVLTDNPHI